MKDGVGEISDPFSKNMEQVWKLYIIQCGDGTLYTGITVDIAHRFAMHQSGKGAKYTRSRLPVELAYREELPDKSSALKREAAIKRLTRPEKLALIAAADVMKTESII